MPVNKIIKIRRDVAADWASANPTLEDGELGYETDTDKLKIGDGLVPWNLLPYFTAGATPPDLSPYATNAALNAHTSNVGNPHSVTKAQVGLSNVPNTDFTAAVAANTAKVSFDVVSQAKLAGIEAGAQVNVVTSVAGKTAAVVLDKNDVGLGQVDNTSDANKPISNATSNALLLKEDKANKDQINGYAGLDPSGKINPSQLPSLAITDVSVVASQAAMLALSAQVGDVAIRTDANKTFILQATPATTLANWIEILAPGGGGGAVNTVFGRSGNVTAQNNDYNQDQVGDGTTYKQYSATEKTKLAGIEAGAEVNNISDANATDLTDGNDSTLHHHLSDRDVKPRLQGGVPYRQTQLDNWFAALFAATSAAPIDVVVIGDSIHALGSVTSPAPPGYFEQYLNQQLGVSETMAVPFGVYAQADYSPTATSTQGTTSTTALGGFGSTLTNTQVLTHVATCTGFSVAYRTDPSYGTITIRDGAGGTILATINCAAAAKSGNVWHSGALSNGSHTLHITSSGTTRVEIIHPNYGHKVRVWNCAHSGYKSADYTTNSYLALDLVDTLETAGTLKLVIIATGANDNGGAGYATDMPALIAAVQSHTSEDLVLWFPYISGALPLAEYTPARAAAYLTGLPIIDASTVAATSLGLDGVHPDVWQKRMLALQETAVLGGDPLGTMIRQIHDTSRGGISIPSPYGSLAEFSHVSKLISPFLGMPGAGLYLSDGVNPVNIAQKSLNQLSISNGIGTLEANTSPAINAQTGTSYTLVLADAGKHITRSNTALSTQTLPQNSAAAIPIGSIISITNIGTGFILFAAGTGATISGKTGLCSGESAEMIKISTNGWLIRGQRRISSGTSRYDGATERDYRIMGDAIVSGTTTTTPSTNRWFFEPYLVTETMVFDRVAIEISTAGAAGKLARLSLWTADDYWQPSTLVQDFGTVATDVGAVPTLQVITLSDLIIQPGRYIGVWIQDGGAAFRVIQALNFPGNGLASAGSTTPLRATFQSLNGSGTVASGFASVSPRWERDLYSTSGLYNYFMRFREKA